MSQRFNVDIILDLSWFVVGYDFIQQVWRERESDRERERDREIYIAVISLSSLIFKIFIYRGDG